MTRRDGDPWEPTRRFFEALDELRAQDPNPTMYRFKDSVVASADLAPSASPLIDVKGAGDDET